MPVPQARVRCEVDVNQVVPCLQNAAVVRGGRRVAHAGRVGHTPAEGELAGVNLRPGEVSSASPMLSGSLTHRYARRRRERRVVGQRHVARLVGTHVVGVRPEPGEAAAAVHSCKCGGHSWSASPVAARRKCTCSASMQTFQARPYLECSRKAAPPASIGGRVGSWAPCLRPKPPSAGLHHGQYLVTHTA